MSEMWRKTLVYLGLVEEPEEHDEHQVRSLDQEPPRAREGGPRQAPAGSPEPAGNVRHLRTPEDRQTHVRLADREATRVTIVRAASFEDAREIGERYRTGNAVLLDLGDVDNRTGRRLLDFLGGTIFALRGRIVPAGERAFLLLHEGADLSREERRRLQDIGYPLGGSAPQAPRA